jgi:hypothetical protein
MRLSFFVGRDMKLHSTLFGWIYPDQALRVAAGFHGSMRLAGFGRMANTARGMEPSR